MPLKFDGVEWLTGKDPYTAEELHEAEARWGFRFPPDLFELYLSGRPEGISETDRVWDWVRDDKDDLADIIGWPLRGFLFDVETNR